MWEETRSDPLLLSVFVLTSTWRASSHPGSETNHHDLRHGAVEGNISNALRHTRHTCVKFNYLPNRPAVLLHVCIWDYACFVALTIIMIIYWARRSEASMEQWQTVCHTKRAAHSHKRGREMIKLLRLYQQGTFYRVRGANSRNGREKRERQLFTAVPHVYRW